MCCFFDSERIVVFFVEMCFFNFVLSFTNVIGCFSLQERLYKNQSCQTAFQIFPSCCVNFTFSNSAVSQLKTCLTKWQTSPWRVLNCSPANILKYMCCLCMKSLRKSNESCFLCFHILEKQDSLLMFSNFLPFRRFGSTCVWVRGILGSPPSNLGHLWIINVV